MPEHEGYIYQRSSVSTQELEALLGSDGAGWAWTPAAMYTRSAHHSDDLLRGEAGCVQRNMTEIRWRRMVHTDMRSNEPLFEVLILSLKSGAPAGFSPVPPDGAAWQTSEHTMRVRKPLAGAAKEMESRPAILFIAPNGAIQFVALLAGAAAAEATDDK